jgi:hypothetical protein
MRLRRLASIPIIKNISASATTAQIMPAVAADDNLAEDTDDESLEVTVKAVDSAVASEVPNATDSV